MPAANGPLATRSEEQHEHFPLQRAASDDHIRPAPKPAPAAPPRPQSAAVPRAEPKVRVRRRGVNVPMLVGICCVRCSACEHVALVHRRLSHGVSDAARCCSLCAQKRVRPPKVGYKRGEDGEVKPAFDLAQGKPGSLLPVLLSGNAATSYAIAPRLPAGLWLDTKSGVISGQPAAAMPVPQMFTVTAANEAGFAETPLQLSVTPERPTVRYPGELRATVGAACALAPHTESVVDSFALEGALPAGITFDAKTGRFAGVPEKASAARALPSSTAAP